MHSLHGKGTDLIATMAPGSTAGRTYLNLPAALPLTAWSRIGTELVAISEASAWWIGDWLVFGQHRYRNRYRRAMEETSLNYQTLRNYAWGARAFEPVRRRAEVSFQHHIEVIALPRGEQDHWLDLAVRLGWSRNDLRKQIRDSEAPAEDGAEPAEPGEVHVDLRVTTERMRQWEDRARRSGRKLRDWIELTLDQACLEGLHR